MQYILSGALGAFFYTIFFLKGWGVLIATLVCTLIGAFLALYLLIRAFYGRGWLGLVDVRCTMCKKTLTSPPFKVLFVYGPTYNPDIQCSPACREERKKLTDDLIREQQELLRLYAARVKELGGQAVVCE